MSAFARRILVGVLFSAMLGAGSNAQGWHHLGNVQHVEVLPDGAELTAVGSPGTELEFAL